MMNMSTFFTTYEWCLLFNHQGDLRWGFPDGSDGKESACNTEDLVWEETLEKGTATHSSILAWRIPGQRGLVGYSPWGLKESDTTEQLTLSLPVYLEETDFGIQRAYRIILNLF